MPFKKRRRRRRRYTNRATPFWIATALNQNFGGSTAATFTQLIVGTSDMRMASPANPAAQSRAFVKQLILRAQFFPAVLPGTGGMQIINWWLMKANGSESSYMITNNINPDNAAWATDDNVEDCAILRTGTGMWTSGTSFASTNDNPVAFVNVNLKGNYAFKGGEQIYLVWRLLNFQGLVPAGGTPNQLQIAMRARCLNP